MTELLEPECGGCGARQSEAVSLFFTPDNWGWETVLQGRLLGLCTRCSTTERYREQFAERFGTVRHVTDSDAGTSADSS